ncbi:MAG: glutathione S-transferase, partial [Rhodospirillaceae bacterium]|nr:glutathione S-transferase [Rhodospirillaceae bacterium]
MLLFYSPFHRFVHKVLVAIHETGLGDDVELVPTFPFRNADGEWVEGQYDISMLNPLGKVPTLTADD